MITIKRLYIKQKVFSLSGEFTIFDENEEPVYKVEGSFLRLPKSFIIYNVEGKKVAIITKKTLAFMPKFFVEMCRREVLTIKKAFSLFQARYTIDGEGIEVRGDWWDMEFEVLQHGKILGSVKKQWFSWGDSYELRVLDESLEELLIAVTVAIDCVKADEETGSAAI